MADVKKGSTINGATLFIEGTGFLGTTATVTLPAIEFETVDTNGGVYQSKLNTKILKELVLTATVNEYNPVIYEALAKSGDAKIYVKWNESKGKKGNFSHVATVRGDLTKYTPPEVKYGELNEVQFEMVCDFYKLEDSGNTRVLIDLDAITCEIDGVDVWQELRENIS